MQPRFECISIDFSGPGAKRCELLHAIATPDIIRGKRQFVRFPPALTARQFGPDGFYRLHSGRSERSDKKSEKKVAFVPTEPNTGHREVKVEGRDQKKLFG